MDTPTILINLNQLSSHKEDLEKRSYMAIYNNTRKNKEWTPRDEAYIQLEKLFANTQVVSSHNTSATHVMVFGKLKLISYKTDLGSRHKAMKSLLNYLDIEFQEDY